MENYYDIHTLNFIVSNMINCKKNRKIYDKYMSTINFDNDEDFNYITTKNIIELFKTTQFGHQINQQYMQKTHLLTIDIFNNEDYIFNISQFLNNKEKVKLSMVNNCTNNYIKSIIDPIYYQINYQYIYNNFTELIKNYINYNDIVQLKITKIVNKLNCVCIGDTFKNLAFPCWVCDFKFIINCNITYFKYIYKRHTNFATEYNLDLKKISSNLKKEMDNKYYNLQKIINNSKNMIGSFNYIYNELNIINYKIHEYLPVIEVYKKNYKDAKNAYKNLTNTNLNIMAAALA